MGRKEKTADHSDGRGQAPGGEDHHRWIDPHDETRLMILGNGPHGNSKVGEFEEEKHDKHDNQGDADDPEVAVGDRDHPDIQDLLRKDVSQKEGKGPELENHQLLNNNPHPQGGDNDIADPVLLERNVQEKPNRAPDDQSKWDEEPQGEKGGNLHQEKELHPEVGPHHGDITVSQICHFRCLVDDDKSQGNQAI